jgi:hypothetical protein
MATQMNDQIDRQSLINAIISIRFRAEKQPESVTSIDSFVPVIDPNLLATPNTQIIYGRNGTGKTHLLRAFYDYCETNFESNKLLAVYIDCRDLDLGSASPVTPDDLVIRFYRRFLYKVIDRLSEFSASVITVPFLQKVFGGDGQERKKKIEERVNHLISILNMEEIEELVKGYSREKKVEQGGSTKMEGNANAGLQLPLHNSVPQIGVGLGFSVNQTQQDNEKIETVYRGLSVIDYQSIRDDLEIIIELCGARAIVLLVDEWSSVSLSIQPILAEMIRKTLAVSNKIFLKIVSLKFFTRTSALVVPPQRIGFQTGSDISLLVDLDGLLNFDLNPQRVTDILTLIAYKHICLEYTELERFPISEFADYISTEIFDDISTYREVVRASEGNPRDFLSILSVCCTLAQKLGEGVKITSRNAVEAAIKHFEENKSPEIKDLPEVNDLFNRIFARVLKNHDKLFLISVKKAETDPRVLELWHNRFIHLVNPNYLEVDESYTPHEYAIFSFDYGKLISLKLNARGEELLTVLEASTGVLARFPSGDTLTSFMGKNLKSVLSSRIVRDSVKMNAKINAKTMTELVKMQGIEIADLTNIDYLIKTCVIDDLLEISP